LCLGLSLQNALAPELTFVSRPVRYPRTLDVAPSYLWKLSGEAAALLTVRVSKTQGRAPKPSGGVELAYRESLCVRAASGEKGVATGFGLRLGNSRFDYGVLLHKLGLSHLLSFTQRFGYTPKELEDSIRKGIRKLNRGEAQGLARTYVRAAELKLGRDDLAGAVNDLEAAALWDPEDPEIPKRVENARGRMEAVLKSRMAENTAALARQEYSKGNVLASRQYWRTVLESEPAHDEARRQLEAIDRRLSQEERGALEDVRRRQRALLLEELARNAAVLMERGQPRKALAVLEDAPAEARQDPKLRTLEARARERLRASASSELERARGLAAAGEHSAALKALEAVLREAPRDAQALQLAEECRAAAGRSVSDEDRKKMERLYYQAVELYLKGSFQQARTLVEQVAEIDPASDSARKLKEKVDAALNLETR